MPMGWLPTGLAPLAQSLAASLCTLACCQVPGISFLLPCLLCIQSLLAPHLVSPVMRKLGCERSPRGWVGDTH